MLEKTTLGDISPIRYIFIQRFDSQDTISPVEVTYDTYEKFWSTFFDKNLDNEKRKEAAELKRVFPNAKENEGCNEIIKKIEAIEAAKKAEEKRLKALGFKAFKDNPTVKFDNVTYSFSGFTYGRTFTFEYVYDVDEYSYEVADKNCTYILASLAISTKENYASNPRVYACEIVDGKLKNINNFRIEYASYNTYGASIGNYSETSHDFSKVSSVKYKMAAQIPRAYTNKPIVIIVSKSSGYLSGEISIDEVRENYEVIKILNRNKL